jgi:lysophospholipase L1-like esterase
MVCSVRRWLAVTLAAVLVLSAAELALRTRYRRRVLPPKPRHRGKVTVAALGDSITAGWPGSPDEAWPALIEARLKTTNPGVAWHVINAGEPGRTAPMGYARFDREVAAHAPDMVLIAFGLNDCHRARHALDRWFEARVPVGPQRSYVWRALLARVARTGRRLGWWANPAYAPEPVPAPFLRTSPERFSAALSALVDRTRDIRGLPVLLTMTPLPEQTPPDVCALLEEYTAYNARIRTVASQRDIPLVELADDAPDGAFTADGLHLTATGQQWVADRVYKTLETAGLWAALARRVR